MKSTIPFSGFYETIHNSAIGQAIDSLFNDNDTLLYRFYGEDCINYGEMYKEYARQYTQAFAQKTKLPVIFDELVSPREYNFHTDRIFVQISPGFVKGLFAIVDKDVLRQRIKEEYTSCEGFISYYSPNLDDWSEDVTEWDHNQIETLISVAVDFDEDQYVEDLLCSGDPDSIVYSALTEKGIRLAKIAEYLKKRQERNT
jgi:hypothetical protein